MMREIIFRAWWKDDNTLLDPKSYVIRPDGTIEFPEGGWDLQGWDSSDLVILEQYTGLKDKNGKKIFEGDIVECHAIETTKVVIVEDIRKIPVQFKWVNIYEGSTIEIIGNIHDQEEDV